MKVSVIMVVRNAADQIAEALDSVRQQRGIELELVVVDGLSTDHTLDIVARYQDLSPRVLPGPDAGIYDAMNKGVAAARGEALFFLNADDRLAQPQALALLAAVLADPAVDIAYGNILVCGPDGDRWRSHRHVSTASLGFESLSHQALLARCSAFARVGDFDLRYRICADLDWLMRAADAGLTLKHLPRLVCRCLTGGISTREQALMMEEVAVLRERRAAARGRHWALASLRRWLRRVAGEDLA